MQRNIYNPNETLEQRRLQNERVKRLLEKWMTAPAWNCDFQVIESELDEAGFRLAEPEIPTTRVHHVPVA